MRLELFFKTAGELKALIGFLRNTPTVTAVNLTNKVKSEPLLPNISTLKEALPELDICQHYSIKYNSQKDPEATYDSFRRFLSGAEERGASEVLLITGSGPKKEINALSCLQRLAQQEPSLAIKLGVAFNPFLPDADELRKEQERLKGKLETGLVSSIYLQIGSDLQRLRAGLDFIKREDGAGRARVVGSVLLPSPRLLAQFKFRPWNGVFLSDEYLSGVAQADAITRQVVQLYREFGVEPLVETAVRGQQDLDRLHALLGDLCCHEQQAHTTAADPAREGGSDAPGATLGAAEALPAAKRPRRSRADGN